MGHTAAIDAPAADTGVYRDLQQRLDRLPTGAPDTPSFRRILRLLFTEEEAELAAHLPSIVAVDRLAARLDRDPPQLHAMVTDMARRGLVFDLEHRGERWVALAPVVIGFFEFTFMRVREDAPIEELARLFDEYLFADDEHRFARSVFEGSVQVGRTMVREEALPERPPTEVLAWERATTVVAEATTVAVSDCPCRTHAGLLGRACDAPVRTCLSFGAAAESLIRADLADPISNEEGLELLAAAKAAGLAQTGDNVQERLTYLCNCCGCCCGMMQAIRRAGLHGAIVPSNWVARIDPDQCRGCRDGCVTACPAGAIERCDSQGQGRRAYWSVLDDERCLGCGVCIDQCRFEALELVPREERSYTPQTTLDRMIAMAVERGKLGDLMLDTLDGAGPVAVARLLQQLERSSLGTALRAVEPLRSVFLRGLLAAVHRGAAAVPAP
jgi:NAD-dependent dihydropyrimidine dehydrogenase PreA subunit